MKNNVLTANNTTSGTKTDERKQTRQKPISLPAMYYNKQEDGYFLWLHQTRYKVDLVPNSEGKHALLYSKGDTVSEPVYLDTNTLLMLSRGRNRIVFITRSRLTGERTFYLVSANRFRVVNDIKSYLFESLSDGANIYETSRRMLLMENDQLKFWHNCAKYCQSLTVEQMRDYQSTHRSLFANDIVIQDPEDILLARKNVSCTYVADKYAGKSRLMIRGEITARHLDNDMLFDCCCRYKDKIVDYLWRDAKVSPLLDKIPKEEWKLTQFNVYKSGYLMIDLLSPPIFKASLTTAITD